jgi:DNA polymerase-3 subunit gamma/tau
MSEQYIVSARKYRPQTFDTVVGQEHITTTLKNAIRTGHIAHAYLFCGPRGVGKTTCARILARTINCENPTPDMEACGQCPTCRSFQDNASFSIFELDAASNNSVDDIRALTEQVRYAPQIGKYKVYIIDEVHMLSSGAFNAFLKTLEEPPSYAIFILATTEKHKILPTILSRCQIFDFKRIQTDDIVQHLAGICEKEHTTAETAALHVMAQKSEGCMRDALSMMDRIAGFTGGQITYAQTVEHLNILDADVYFKLTDILLSKDIAAALLLTDEVLQKGFEGDIMLNGFAEHFRDLLLCKDGSMAKLLDVPDEHKRIYFEKAQIISTPYILAALNMLNEAALNYRNALNKRLHVELCLMKLCYLNDVLDLAQLPRAEADEASKKKADNLAITSSKPQQQEILPDTASTLSNNRQEMTSPPQEESRPQPSKASVNTTENAKTKISKDLYKAVLAAHSQEQAEVQQKTLNQEVIEQLFAQFINSMRKQEQLSIATNLAQMKIMYEAPDFINLRCVSSINYHFAINQKDDLLEFFVKETGHRALRLTAAIDDSIKPVEPEKKYKTKSELYQEMVAQNPLLKTLKDGLNLQLE